MRDAVCDDEMRFGAAGDSDWGREDDYVFWKTNADVEKS